MAAQIEFRSQHEQLSVLIIEVSEIVGIPVDINLAELTTHPENTVGEMHQFRTAKAAVNREEDVYRELALKLANENDPAAAIKVTNYFSEVVATLDQTWQVIEQLIEYIQQYIPKGRLDAGAIKARMNANNKGRGLEMALPRLKALEKTLPQMLAVAKTLQPDLKALKLYLNQQLDAGYTSYAVSSTERRPFSAAETSHAIVDAVQNYWKSAAFMLVIATLFLGADTQDQTLNTTDTNRNSVTGTTNEETENEEGETSNEFTLSDLLSQATNYVKEVGNLEQIGTWLYEAIEEAGLDIEMLRENYQLAQPENFEDVSIRELGTVSFLLEITTGNGNEYGRMIRVSEIESALEAAGFEFGERYELTIEWNEADNQLDILVDGNVAASIHAFTDATWNVLRSGEIQPLLDSELMRIYPENFEEEEPEIVMVERDVVEISSSYSGVNFRILTSSGEIDSRNEIFLSNADVPNGFMILETDAKTFQNRTDPWHLVRFELDGEVLERWVRSDLVDTDNPIEVVEVATPAQVEESNPNETETPAATPRLNETPEPVIIETPEDVVRVERTGRELVVTVEPNSASSMEFASPDILDEDMHPEYAQTIATIRQEFGNDCFFENGGELYVETTPGSASRVWIDEDGTLILNTSVNGEFLRTFEVVEVETNQVVEETPIIDLPTIGNFAGSTDPNPTAVRRSPAFQQLIKVLPEQDALRFASIASGGSILETVVVDADTCEFTGDNSVYSFRCGTQNYTSFSNMTRLIEISSQEYIDHGGLNSRAGDVDPTLEQFFENVSGNRYTRLVLIVNHPTNPNWSDQAAVIIAVTADPGIEISSSN